MGSDSGCTVRRYKLRVAPRRSGEAVAIPRFVVRGSRGGPVVTVTAGQHGRELNGVEASRRFLEWVRGRALKGTVQVFPAVNPPAIRAVSQTVPGETQNPNRVWPGRDDGTMAERIAAAVAPFIVKSDYLIDLHAWSEWTVSTTLIAGPEDAAGFEAAQAFGLPFIYGCGGEFHPGNLKTFARAHGVVSIGAELTPQWRLREAAVEAGLTGIANVLRHLKMLRGRPKTAPRQWLYTRATPRRQVLAKCTGLYVRDVEPGRPVGKGRLLGRLYTLDGLALKQRALAPIDGLLINTGTCCHAEVESNVVQAGDILAEVWKANRLR